MKITFRDHRGMGRALAGALVLAGHDVVDAGGDVLLIDHDLPVGDYLTRCDAHARVLVYPHGAGLVASGDGQWPVHPHTIARLEHGPGQVEVLWRAGYPRPAEVIGWPLCTRRPFTPRPLRHVLLAPQHAMSDGWYAPELRAQNVRVYEALAAWAAQGLIELTVRFVFAWPPLGLVARPRVRYEQGDGSLADALESIDRADCVVGACWTFPTLAVARGVPTLMYGQLPLDDDYGPAARHPAQSWPVYRDYVRFPLDPTALRLAGEPDGLYALLQRACATDEDIATWRDLFIGPAFDPVRFVRVVERLGDVA